MKVTSLQRKNAFQFTSSSTPPPEQSQGGGFFQSLREEQIYPLAYKWQCLSTVFLSQPLSLPGHYAPVKKLLVIALGQNNRVLQREKLKN